ncbi:MAG: hypothetical protein H6Q00_1515 [Holophagaceae bacterium]|nr:hypothetical protein [Holophagaceae bacterium]
MDVEYDPAKNARNIELRGLSFERARDLDWDRILLFQDHRNDYGETRWLALGFLEARLHVLVFLETMKGIRVISFRKANERERRRYDQAKTVDRQRG